MSQTCKVNVIEMNCRVDVWEGSEDGYCILHEPNPEKPVEPFREKLLEQLEEKDNTNIHFVGYHFPEGFSEFANLVENATGEKLYSLDAIFDLAIFHDRINFMGLTFQGEASFYKTKFKDMVLFDKATFEEDVGFKYAIFGDSVKISDCTFQKQLHLYETNFANPSDAEVLYRKASRILEEEGLRDFSDYHFRQEMRAKRKQLFPHNFINATPNKIKGWIRKLKSKIENIRRRQWYINTKELRDKVISYLIDLTTGYGTSWVRVLGSWVIVISGFWGGYSFFDSLQYTASQNISNGVSVIEKLYFSIITFTTLGYGDLVPKGTIWKLVSGSESIIGGILMATFVLVLGRKFMK